MQNVCRRLQRDLKCCLSTLQILHCTTGFDLRGNALGGVAWDYVPLKLWFDNPHCLICAYARAPAIAPTSTHAHTCAPAAPSQVLFACPRRGSSLAPPTTPLTTWAVPTSGSLQLDAAAAAVAAEAHYPALWVGFAKEERAAVEAALEGADGFGLPRALEPGREGAGGR